MMSKIFKFNLSSFIYTTWILVLAACANNVTFGPNYGPVQEENFTDIFLESINDDQQRVIFYSRAIWYPNKNGFKLIPVGGKSRKGVIVCTDKKVYFSEWSINLYNELFSAGYKEINYLRLAAKDLFGRVVIQAKNYNSFEILGVSGPDLPDKKATDVAYQIIEQRKQQ